MNERWPSNMIPHLSRNHCQTEKQRPRTPHIFVVQKIQIIPAQIHKTTGDTEQNHEGKCARIIRGAKHTNLNREKN